MESYWETDSSEKEKKIKETLSQDKVIGLIEYLIEIEKDTFKNKMEKLPKGDFYKEAMDNFIAKGGCIALESLKLKLISYVGE